MFRRKFHALPGSRRPAKLADKTGVPTHRIHVKQGYTRDVVEAVACEIDAALVLMGAMNQIDSLMTVAI